MQQTDQEQAIRAVIDPRHQGAERDHHDKQQNWHDQVQILANNERNVLQHEQQRRHHHCQDHPVARLKSRLDKTHPGHLFPQVGAQESDCGLKHQPDRQGLDPL